MGAREGGWDVPLSEGEARNRLFHPSQVRGLGRVFWVVLACSKWKVPPEWRPGTLLSYAILVGAQVPNFSVPNAWRGG